MISVVSGLALQAPIIAKHLLPAEPPGMVVHIFGAMAVFIGVMLAFFARDTGEKHPNEQAPYMAKCVTVHHACLGGALHREARHADSNWL